MDVLVTPERGGRLWLMSDQLKRPLGKIEMDRLGRYLIVIHQSGFAALGGLEKAAYPSLHDVLAEIKACVGGDCRLVSSSEEPML
jgi:hypothetical protein